MDSNNRLSRQVRKTHKPKHPCMTLGGRSDRARKKFLVGFLEVLALFLDYNHRRIVRPRQHCYNFLVSRRSYLRRNCYDRDSKDRGQDNGVVTPDGNIRDSSSCWGDSWRSTRL